MRLLDVVVLLSAGGALVLLRGGTPTSVQPPDSRRLRPGLALGLVSAALILNQVLVVVYIEGVHDGDVTFVSRWLPDGWFELPQLAVLDRLAGAWPAPELLAPSLLRVPALLELPFVVLAYVTVAGFLSPLLAQRLSRGAVLWAASLSFTAVFCLIEWHLSNPWTEGDLVLRGISGLATPLLVARFVRSSATAIDAPLRTHRPDPVGLALFVVSSAALGHLVLVTYDTILLYNLGRVDRHLVPVAVSATVLLAARLAASWRTGTGSAAEAPSASLRGWVDPKRSSSVLFSRLLTGGFALFYIPSLAVRYEVTFASRLIAVGAVCVISIVAVLGARPSAVAALRLVAAAALTAALGWAARSVKELPESDHVAVFEWFPHTYEALLLATATTAALALLAMCAVVDRLGAQWDKRAGGRLGSSPALRAG